MSFASNVGASVDIDHVETPFILDAHTFANDTEYEAATQSDSPITQHNVDQYIDYALKRLCGDNFRRKVKGQTNLINRIAPFIEKYGVKSDHFCIILDLILCQALSPRSTTKLLSFLLPRTAVSQKEVIRIIGHLSQRDYPADILQSLLQWVACVYNLIDGEEHITKLYGLLFHYLTLERLRPQICHLLFLMTKKVHVKPYRVRFLLKLLEKGQPEPQLIALLKVYQSYWPSMGAGLKYVNLKQNPFYNVYSKIQSKVTEIHRLWLDDTTPRIFDEQQVASASAQMVCEAEPAKKRTKSQQYMGIKFLQEEKPDMFDPELLLTYLDRQSIPEQISSILGNRMIQHVIVCNPNDVVIPRVCDILAQQLMDLLYWNRQTAASNKVLKELLYKILQVARFTKAHIPVMETFLERYLCSWNGIDLTSEIFELLTYIKPSSFQVLFESYLKPLYRLYCVSDVQWKAKLILCYRNWLKNWALLDWYRHAERKKHFADESEEDTMDSIAWLFQGISFNTDYFAVMQQMIYHVDRLCVQGLVLEQDHPILQHVSLSFFEFTASMSLQHDIPSIVLPAASLVYRSFFSPNATVVSRICGILHKYKLSFESNDRQAEDWMDKHSEDYLDHFNTYVLDICNCLWRNLAFDHREGSSSTFALSPDIIAFFHKRCDERGDSLNLLFSLTHSSAFVGFSKQFMKIKTEELGLQSQPEDLITVESVKALVNIEGEPMSYMDYRVDYLDYLNDLGFRGVYDLLYTCMASLIKRKEQKQDTNEQEEGSNEEE
ncbi:hypothetical protein [Absidia glauca]|uniref:Mis6-domain-containing protein n=1 Tax=Absidia glauca TaxID=4829 RepID=A0A163LP92_ABSGL|nr:hypothetical protein [Absidia glauca]